MQVTAVLCPKCDDLLWMRVRNDWKHCSCKNVTFTNSANKMRVSSYVKTLPTIHEITLPAVTRRQAEADLHDGVDALGRIKNGSQFLKGVKHEQKETGKEK